MDAMFRRWVRLPTVLALVKPKYGRNPVQVRFFTEDKATKDRHSWLTEDERPSPDGKTFLLYDTEYNPDGTMKNGELAKMAENFVGKNISVDRWYQNETTDCFLIEVKEK